VAVAAKSQGKMDTGVGMIEGESVQRVAEPEVIYCDGYSSATLVVHLIRVDTGLVRSGASSN